MLHMALVFLVIGLIAALLGFTTIAGASIAIAKFLAGLFLVLFLVFLIIGLLRDTPHRRLTTDATMEDLGSPRSSIELPLPSAFPVPPPRLVLALAAVLSSQTAPAPALTLLAQGGPARRCRSRSSATRKWSASTISPPRSSSTVREESLGAITVSYKGQNDCPDARPAAGVGVGPAGLAAGAAGADRPPLAGAGRVHQPRARARFTTRASISASRRACSSSATCACRASPSATSRSAPPARLTIDATPRATANVTQETDHLTIKFDADALDVPNPPLPAQQPQGLLQGVRVARRDDARGRSRSTLRRLQGDEPAGRHDDAPGDRPAVGADRHGTAGAAPAPPPPAAAARAAAGVRPADVARSTPSPSIRATAATTRASRAPAGASEKDVDARGRAAR